MINTYTITPTHTSFETTITAMTQAAIHRGLARTFDIEASQKLIDEVDDYRDFYPEEYKAFAEHIDLRIMEQLVTISLGLPAVTPAVTAISQEMSTHLQDAMALATTAAVGGEFTDMVVDQLTAIDAKLGELGVVIGLSAEQMNIIGGAFSGAYCTFYELVLVENHRD